MAEGTRAYHVKYRVLIPFALVLAGIVGAFVLTAHLQEERRHRAAIAEYLSTAQQLHLQKMDVLANILEALLESLADKAPFQHGFATGDRDRLLAAALPAFQAAKEKYRVTHFYFMDADRRVFLRVHQPQRTGDVIERATALDAARTGRTSTGLELGPLGTLTLRAVRPWDKDGRRIGYLELGIEIEDIVADIRNAMGRDMLVLVRKDLLKADDWAAGMKMLGRSSEWDRLPGLAVVLNTLPTLPAALRNWLAGAMPLSRHHFEFVHDGKSFLAGGLPILDSRLQEIGNFVVVADTTASRISYTETLRLTAALSILAGIAVFALLSRVLGRVEQQLEGAWLLLEERVEERTRELSAEIARRFQIELDLRRANEELERVAHVAAHDLQEPARSVISFAQLLSKRYGSSLGDEAREYLGFLVADARRMRNLVKDLLSYAQLWSSEAGQREAVATGRAVVAAMSALEEPVLATEAHISVAPDLPTVTAERPQIVELFRQLLDNALKFRHPARRPVINVSARPQDGHWEFSVADNGIGIDPQYQDKVFVAFRRLHTGDAYSGSGVGLAMARRIVERHHGRIWVESTPDRGTVVRFTLPVHAPASSAETEVA
ncbi:MAG: ATP-binding protein [Magnetospirillum sp. WYHS-4]